MDGAKTRAAARPATARSGDAVTAPGVPLVRALDRGVALLKAFTPELPRRSLAELARAAELDKGTARRLLQTLVISGLVDFDDRSGSYALSAAILELGAAVETGREVREVAAPYLADIARTCHVTAFLWVHHDGMAVCTERVRASQPSIDASWFNVGVRTALNCGGGPRTLLAYLTPQQQAVALSRPLTARTPASQTEPETLLAAAERIRKLGYELAVDDFVMGLAALGVPVFDRSSSLAGSISVSGLTAQIVQDGRPIHLDILRDAADEISRKLI